MNSMEATNVANDIIALYEQHGGSEYAGEKVSQLEHMLQAARLAEMEGYEEEVILAAFLHDIGHICVSANEENGMDGWGVKDHEDIGADYLLQKGFSQRLAQLVASHVTAKRYLTFKNTEYYEQLSEASKQTLAYQGGPMDVEEATAFEANPLFTLMVKMRYWDDVAKIENLELGDLEKYRTMIKKHLEQNNQAL